jgi:hypothetical protein
MTVVTVYGFPISTFVNIIRLVLTHKNVAFDFHDLEPEMGSPNHLALNPFNRVIMRVFGSTRPPRLPSTSTKPSLVPHFSQRICASVPVCTNGSARSAAITTPICPII